MANGHTYKLYMHTMRGKHLAIVAYIQLYVCTPMRVKTLPAIVCIHTAVCMHRMRGKHLAMSQVRHTFIAVHVHLVWESQAYMAKCERKMHVQLVMPHSSNERKTLGHWETELYVCTQWPSVFLSLCAHTSLYDASVSQWSENTWPLVQSEACIQAVHAHNERKTLGHWESEAYIQAVHAHNERKILGHWETEAYYKLYVCTQWEENTWPLWRA